jgi:lysophospholipase L1-like esterase
MPIGLGIGIGISIGGGSGGGVSPPRIQLSGLSIAEDAAGDTEIGTASVANAPEGVTYTWAITSDPDSKFAIDETTGVLTLATMATLDWETATSHLVTIEADNGVDPPIEREFTISVTNVIEAPVNVTPPAVTGTVAVGSTLSCSTGSWTDMAAGSYAYQWKDAADDSDISGATSSTLLLEREHAALELYCSVTATNSAGSGTPEPSNTVGPVPAIVPDAFVLADWDLDPADEEADVTINSLPDDGGDTITDIEYRIDGGSWVSSGGTSSFTIVGLTNDQEYDVELRAVNGVGEGAASDVKQVTPEEDAGIPVTGQTASYYASDFAASSDQAQIATWSDVSGNAYDMTQATAGNRPLWSVQNQALMFDGKGVANTSVPYDRRAVSVLWIGETNIVDAAQYMWEFGTLGLMLMLEGGTFRIWRGSATATNFRPPVNRTIAVLVACSASGVSVYVDDVANVQNISANGASTGTGFKHGLGSGALRAATKELHIWPFALDATQAEQVLDYAATKYGTGFAASAPSGYAIFDGDSTMECNGVPNFNGVVRNLGPFGTWWPINYGINGARLDQMDDDAGTEINTPFANGTNWLFVLGGNNDLGAGDSGATVESELAAYCNAAITAGFDKSHIVVFTLANSNTFSGRRDDANTAIRANYTSYAGWLVDQAADANIGITPGGGFVNGSYYSDGVHKNAAGNALFAALIKSTVTDLPWE